MKCISCGREVIDYVKFSCPTCGREIVRCKWCRKTKTPWQCECGEEGP